MASLLPIVILLILPIADMRAILEPQIEQQSSRLRTTKNKAVREKCDVARGRCHGDRGCDLATVCADDCGHNAQCRQECDEEAATSEARAALRSLRSCIERQSIAEYQDGEIAGNIGMRYASTRSEAGQANHQAICPADSKAKAEAIAITRATDKVKAVCRNARICVGGLRQAWRFSFFDVRPGRGPCSRWAGGSTSACSLEVTTASTKTDDGWHVKVRSLFGGDHWVFPVVLLNLGRDFKQTGIITLSNKTADELAEEAHGAEQQVLVVGHGQQDILEFDISCDEVTNGYSNGALPEMPSYVKRKDFPTLVDEKISDTEDEEEEEKRIGKSEKETIPVRDATADIGWTVLYDGMEAKEEAKSEKKTASAVLSDEKEAEGKEKEDPYAVLEKFVAQKYNAREVPHVADALNEVIPDILDFGSTLESFAE